MTFPSPTLALAALLLAASVPASAHKGGLDPYGCHPDDKVGVYHCHQGVLNGFSFGSRADMLGPPDNARRALPSLPVRAQIPPPDFDALAVCSEGADEQQRRACFDRIAPRGQ